jgi:hypothetical protein
VIVVGSPVADTAEMLTARFVLFVAAMLPSP